MKKAPTPHHDPAHDVMHYERQPLDAIFAPRTVALIGATEKPASVGRTILWNLLSTPFGGTLFPVHPTRPSVLGIKAYPSVKAVPAEIDLAVVVTPAPTIPGIVAECVEKGVRGAIIVSAGFREVGPAGAELERRILEHARRGGLRIIGPNCLGVMSPVSGLNATFAHGMAKPGTVGFVSQSGALCTAILDWSLRQQVGFSHFISVGSMLDVGWGDLIDYLGTDPRTQSIVMYMESIGDARAFLSAAREVALTKPIIVIKAGRTEAAAKAAASHTGAMTGADDVLDAAFRRCGVLRVNSIADLFYMAEVLAKQPRPKGPRLLIVTNAGGPGVLATDALILNGGKLAEISKESREAFDRVLPPVWSHNNPVDIIGDAPPERYAQALAVAAKDPGADGLLVILAPQDMTDPTATAAAVAPYARIEGRPVLASWMGGASVAAGEQVLLAAGIPNFPYPDTAARAFNYMWRYAYNLRGIYETPILPAAGDEPSGRREEAFRLVGAARQAGRTLLTEFESKRLLAAYGIPTVQTRLAATGDDAARAAEELGFPVVLKLHSETVAHKTDVGGVVLQLQDAAAVRGAFADIEKSVLEKAGKGHFLGVTVQPMVRLEGYELILGSTLDPQFGPVLLFGTGGQLVEVFQDRALALPPLNSTLAIRMMEQTRIFAALKGVRGRRAVDVDALAGLLVRFSHLVAEQRWIREIDINPLLASPDGMIALDARVVLHGKEVTEDRLPPLAVTPYPAQYVSPWTMKDGTRVTIRPIRPEDEPRIVKFHETLSDRTVYRRYIRAMNLDQRVQHERLIRICFNDYARELALVAEWRPPGGEEAEIIAVGRLSRIHGGNQAEFAILVGDRWQGRGLGTELLRRLVQAARDMKIGRIVAHVLPDNREMQKVCAKLGFTARRGGDDPLVRVELDLATAPAAPRA